MELIGWALHSCLCEITLAKEGDSFTLDSWQQKCALHKDVVDGRLLDALFTHDRQWNSQLSGTQVDKTNDLIAFKNTECDRIKALGDVVRNV